MSEEIQIAGQWLAKAEYDLLNADNNLAANQVPYDTVCFHCQQAAEKLLKAFLIGNGQPAAHTHDLFLLLEKVLPFSVAATEVLSWLQQSLPEVFPDSPSG